MEKEPNGQGEFPQQPFLANLETSPRAQGQAFMEET